MEVATYHSTNTKNPLEAWVGYILMPRDGRQLTIRFSGPDEQTVISRAHAFWETHIRKHLGSTPDLIDGDDDADPSPSWRGKGKTWLYNRSTGERARVSNDEVEGYLARGFIKAGPRTK
jgi:hypothetical protein